MFMFYLMTKVDLGILNIYENKNLDVTITNSQKLVDKLS